LRFDLGLVDLQLGVRLALDDLDVHACIMKVDIRLHGNSNSHGARPVH
jgi:hypothetical protein